MKRQGEEMTRKSKRLRRKRNGISPLPSCLLLVIALWGFSGCQTYTETIKDAMSSYQMGRMTKARGELNAVMNTDKEARHLFQLERGMTNLALGDAEGAVKDFTAAIARMDKLISDESFIKDTASYVLDDTVRDYVGSPFEQICARVFMGLAYLLMPGHFEDVSATCRDLDIKMEQIEAFFEKVYRFDAEGQQTDFAFQIPPLAKYFAALAAERRGELDNAAIYMKQAILTAPDNRFFKKELARMKRGDNKNLVFVFGLLGMVPQKEEKKFKELTGLLGGVRAAYAASKPEESLDGLTEAALTVPVKIPAYPERKPFWHGGFKVRQGTKGSEVSTVSLADFDEYARKEYDSVFPGLAIRTLVRRFVKEGIGKVGGSVVGSYLSSRSDNKAVVGAVAGLFSNLFTAALTAAETLDTRSWCTLPREFHAACIALEPGVKSIFLTPIGIDGKPLGPEEEVPIEISDGDPAFVLVFHPAQRADEIVVVDEAHRRSPAAEPLLASEGEEATDAPKDSIAATGAAGKSDPETAEDRLQRIGSDRR